MFVAISFGPKGDSNKFWNHISYHFSQIKSENWALEQYSCLNGCIGYVVIKTGKDSWRVVDETGAENVTISPKGSFFTVQPAPKLVLV